MFPPLVLTRSGNAGRAFDAPLSLFLRQAPRSINCQRQIYSKVLECQPFGSLQTSISSGCQQTMQLKFGLSRGNRQGKAPFADQRFFCSSQERLIVVIQRTDMPVRG